MEVTAIYGSPQPSKRFWLWYQLDNMISSITNPWILIGDFNTILSSQEHFEGSQRRSAACFTWKKGNLMQRLDRAIANSDFCLKFLDVSLYSAASQTNRQAPFCFLSAWLTHESFADFVANNWRDHSSFMETMLEFVAKLKVWNYNVFGNVFH
ncbi:hypothetical protein P3X46_006184 [Hevea brasiliensis]|uniref:Endonuclease/exonuclease/phosphatase domain-containing protein n=1 Tax=Hevea brasiliensis TaxID=3981 RepID=A0ABQ9MPE6_HEVBR|nr:hypothetical protein P3X46_006184 [Hevea brasiliensis]